jgi:hypothetical protein
MTPQEFYDERLAAWKKAWDGGIYPAIFETIGYCNIWKIPLPEWAVDPMLHAIRYAYDNEPVAADGGGYSSRRGRTSMDFAHFLRWRAVKNQLFAHGLKELPSSPGRPSKAHPRPTKDAILKAAASVLQLNDVRKETSRVDRELEALEESYREVEASREAGEGRFLFDELTSFGNP